VADAFYQQFRNSIFGVSVHSFSDLDTDTIKIVFYDEGADALNLADEDLADIIAGARIHTSTGLTGKTVGVVAVGVFDHDNYTAGSVTGASIESLTYYKDSGAEATSPLIANIDSATGLPVTPNGGDIIWTPNASGVFQIT